MDPLRLQIDDVLPPNQYYGYYAPEFRLHVAPARIIDNMNTRVEVERIKNTILEQLAHLEHAPGMLLWVQ